MPNKIDLFIHSHPTIVRMTASSSLVVSVALTILSALIVTASFLSPIGTPPLFYAGLGLLPLSGILASVGTILFILYFRQKFQKIDSIAQETFSESIEEAPKPEYKNETIQPPSDLTNKERIDSIAQETFSESKENTPPLVEEAPKPECKNETTQPPSDLTNKEREEVGKIHLQYRGLTRFGSLYLKVYDNDTGKDIINRTCENLNIDKRDWEITFFVAGKMISDNVVPMSSPSEWGSCNSYHIFFKKKARNSLSRKKRIRRLVKKIPMELPPLPVKELREAQRTQFCSQKFWHGTTANEEGIKDIKQHGFKTTSNRQVLAGDGVYLAFTKEHASKYTLESLPPDALAGGTSRIVGKELKIKIPRLDKTADIQDKEKLDAFHERIIDQITDYFNSHPGDEDGYDQEGNLDIQSVNIFNKILRQSLRAEGYDSAYLHGEALDKVTGGPTLAIISKKKIHKIKIIDKKKRVAA